jgi:FkbM family methyltransferase
LRQALKTTIPLPVVQALRRGRALIATFKGLLREGKVRGPILFFLRSMFQSRRPVELFIRSRRIIIRPCTPDLDVAKSCFAGEFEAAIKAASPLKHGFIIDAGGYIGTSAIAFAEAFPQAQIISLEPSKENFDILSRNVRAYPNIIAVNKALGAHGGSIALRDRGTGEWGFSIVDCRRSTVLHNVQLTTIPALLQEFSSRGIDILKLDIEGGEFELLKDRPQWIQNSRVIIAELHDYIIPGCEAAFRNAMCGRIQMECSGEKTMSVSAS